MRLFSYKLKYDSGFAPNPFFGEITLATCKSLMRNSKRVDDWIAGFTSKELCGDEVGKEKLIYLMKVERKIPISKYFSHPDFQNKIPDSGRDECIYKSGDNIYKPQGGSFIQLENCNHDLSNKIDDLSGRFVLASTRFYYFGSRPLLIPDQFRPSIPTGSSPHGNQTHNAELAEAFINWVTIKFEMGVQNAPHKWPQSDVSWRAP